jgi:protein-L-isoaspartate(D-aspartate) O-methyltransferase
MATIRREDFVPPGYRALAFADLALPLPEGEQMMKPVLEGRCLQALQLQSPESVLEVGTGSGYLTACLTRLAREVVSIERHASLAESAKARLAAGGHANARVECADLFGFQPGRRFDAICLTGAVAEIPAFLADWLNESGRLFAVRGLSPVMEAVCLVRRGEHLAEESLFETDLPYLHGAKPKPAFVL